MIIHNFPKQKEVTENGSPLFQFILVED